MTKKIKRKKLNNKIAILYSPREGGAWSSWNHKHREFLCLDADLIDLHINKATDKEAKDYCKKALGEDLNLEGWEELEVFYIKEGTKFIIHENNGSEYILTEENLIFTA